ncbi:MAG: hypothetical protein HQM12_14905, partial [SAR324 cluster bacterium]|nr:hypothetical protein [SAR324 cluster bacterium]
GLIQIEFEWLESLVRIHYQDDGRGLDLDKIMDKARGAGLIVQDKSPVPEKIAELIFESGLSTAMEVTDISGRGVGMDAVKKFIEQQGGTVHIEFIHPIQQNPRPFKILITLPSVHFKKSKNKNRKP